MERVNLAWHAHAERRRWRSGGEWDEAAPKVAVGKLSRGRWYVRVYAGGLDDARAYGGKHAEQLAEATARRWMRTIGGEWVEA